MKSKQKLLDKYVLYLETLSSSTINSLDHYVAENVRFKDPFNDVMGSERMKAVFLHMFDNVEDVKFNVHIGFIATMTGDALNGPFAGGS